MNVNLYVLIAGLGAGVMSFMWSSKGFGNCFIKLYWTLLALTALKLLWNVPLEQIFHF